MNGLSIVLLFGGGIVAGLFFSVLLKLLNFQFITDLTTAVTNTLGRFLRIQAKVLGKKRSEDDLPVDPREQQINDSVQVIRAILLSLGDVIQRTDHAASNSSSTLGDVRTIIDDMQLPQDLSKVQNLLIQEIDRVISSNTTLKKELDSSKDILEEQRQQIENLKTAVRIDGLTQLSNRVYFEEKLTEMIRLLERYHDPFSLLMIDVDNFKPINDTFGHQAGDRILKGIALKLKASVRESDFIARFGGDEFAVILSKTQSAAASEVGWKICLFLRESRFLLDEKEVAVTVSIGVTEITLGDTPDTLIKRADEALYRAKQEGRNRAVLAAPPEKTGDPGESPPG